MVVGDLLAIGVNVQQHAVVASGYVRESATIQVHSEFQLDNFLIAQF